MRPYIRNLVFPEISLKSVKRFSLKTGFKVIWKSLMAFVYKTINYQSVSISSTDYIKIMRIYISNYPVLLLNTTQRSLNNVYFHSFKFSKYQLITGI